MKHRYFKQEDERDSFLTSLTAHLDVACTKLGVPTPAFSAAETSATTWLSIDAGRPATQKNLATLAALGAYPLYRFEATRPSWAAGQTAQREYYAVCVGRDQPNSGPGSWGRAVVGSKPVAELH